jgi:MATE family multidrug resistance protein
MFMAVVLGMIGWGVMAFLAYNFHWLQQSPQVEALAKQYLYITAPSMPALLLFIAVRNFTDGLSQPLPAMFLSFLGFFCNVFLNWLLIFGKWGFPELGVAGAAYATLISRYLMFLGIYAWAMLDARFRPYLIGFSLLNIRKMFFLKNLRIGLPSGGQFFFEVGAFSGAGIIVGWLGDNPLAAHQIALSLSSATYMVSLGVSIAGGVLVGSAFGERNPQKMKRYGSAAFMMVTGFMAIMATLFIVFPDFWVKLYLSEIKSAEVIPIAVSLVILAGIYQLADGLQCVGLGVLRGMEDTHIPTIVTFVAYWLIGLPCSYYFAFYLGLQSQGVWIALSLALTFASVMHLWRFYNRVGKVSMKK